ncbi:MAG: TrkH family potassium uptake protein [Spirochaetales bacterium]|nr:TrkH family potassium uptake protein [Spirochaetales bacterium]MCF7938518.1 TrkH family potassium uptake protein [Spirochaetales bacterium]
MRIATVLRVFSVFLLLLSGFMLIPVVVALFYGETEYVASFLIPVAINSGVFGLLYSISQRHEQRSLSIKGGLLFVTMTWFAAAATGALPFIISGAIPSYADAFFETISGFTTTGASILTEIEALPYSLLFWRSLTHWLGGMGIVVLAVAVFPLIGSGGFQLVKAEAPGPSVDKVTPRITETAKILWFLYLIFTAVETALLMFGGMDLFEALTHTFGTLATGGFSPKNSSIGFYSSAYIHIVITVFMMMAGINFILYHRLLRGNLLSIRKNTEIKVYLGIFLAAMLIIALDLFSRGVYGSFGESLRFAGFQAASILTTTGYATADFDAWPQVAKIVLFLLMFVGGSSGSTGGGIKVVRIAALFKLGLNELRYIIQPRGVFTIKINGSRMKKDIMYVVAGFFFLYIFLLMMTTIVVATSEQNILTSFSTALVTLGNIGPGFGAVGPTMNYSFYPDYIKWFLSVIMVIGRLEIYTVLVLLVPRFWRR